MVRHPHLHPPHRPVPATLHQLLHPPLHTILLPQPQSQRPPKPTIHPFGLHLHLLFQPFFPSSASGGAGSRTQAAPAQGSNTVTPGDCLAGTFLTTLPPSTQIRHYPFPYPTPVLIASFPDSVARLLPRLRHHPLSYPNL